VTSYDVSYHCNRTGEEVNEMVTSPPTERIFEAEQDCLYIITMRARGHEGYSINCYPSTSSEPVVLLLLLLLLLVVFSKYSQLL